MATQKILKKYSFSLLWLAGGIFAYSVFRIASCAIFSRDIYAAFCKLSGFVYWNFYGLPILALALIGILLPKLSDSEKLHKFTLAFMALTTARFVYLILDSIFSKSI